jgi:hypothetical protein
MGVQGDDFSSRTVGLRDTCMKTFGLPSTTFRRALIGSSNIGVLAAHTGGGSGHEVIQWIRCNFYYISNALNYLWTSTIYRNPSRKIKSGNKLLSLCVKICEWVGEETVSSKLIKAPALVSLLCSRSRSSTSSIDLSMRWQWQGGLLIVRT